MIRVRPRMAKFCMGRGSARVRTRSPPTATQQQQQYKRSHRSFKIVKELTSSEFSSKNSIEMNYDKVTNNEADKLCGNRVMIVVDSSIEAKAALNWALSHTIQSQDTIILLHVLLITKPSTKGGKINLQVNQRAYKLLSIMKNTCQMQKPGVQVEISVKEGKEKGATIVQVAKQEKVSLLVLGKRKRSVMWRLQKMWAGKRKRICFSAADYCVQNASCMTVAVRRKSRKHGGYLITTKQHKDFWLLA